MCSSVVVVQSSFSVRALSVLAVDVDNVDKVVDNLLLSLLILFHFVVSRRVPGKKSEDRVALRFPIFDFAVGNIVSVDVTVKESNG